jgi:hypothetical protein
LAFSLDRLARKPEDLRALQEEIQAAGARLLIAQTLTSAYFCNPDESRLGLTMTTDYPLRERRPL